MSDRLDKLLTPAEYERLAKFLAQCVDGIAPNLEALDGFFCALVAGPDVILPSEYLPLILGSGSRFDSLEEVHRLLPLLMRHWNKISLTLDRGEIYPLYLLKRRPYRYTGADWAEGFMRGVELRSEQWQVLFDRMDYNDATGPIMILAQEKDPELDPPARPMTKAARNELLAMMAGGLADIYDYFRQRRWVPDTRESIREPERRATPKVGRNEPCPCGSGKKYKLCCAAPDGGALH